MPNFNNGGFAIAPATYCQDGFKPVYWADDTEDDGHSVRRGTLPCAALAALAATPPTDVAEFPFAALSLGGSAIARAGWFAIRRRSTRVMPFTVVD